MNDRFRNARHWGIVVMLLLSCTAMADTIVKWGESGGDTNILTAGSNTACQNTPTNIYYESVLMNPTDGSNGYDVDAAGKTHEFSGAFDPSGFFNVFVNNAAGDYMQLVGLRTVGETQRCMVAWQASEFLSDANELKSMVVEFAKARPQNTPTVSFLLETPAGWYKSDQTATAESTATYASFSNSASALTWSPFGEFGVSPGIGSPDIADIQSVGVHHSTTISSDEWTGIKLRYVEVMATNTMRTVVKWGEAGGDAGIIVTNASADSSVMDTTYTFGSTITKDAPSTAYYENYDASEDTPLFNGAGSLDGRLEVRSSADGDCFYYPKNLGTGSHQQMYAWEARTHTLNSGGTLRRFVAESKLRQSNNFGTRRFLIKESGSWYVSETNTVTDSYTSWSSSPSALDWFEFTPFSGGAHTIGGSASPSFAGYEAVGVFYDSGVTEGSWADIRTRYFRVYEIPPPLGMLMIVR
jgi:hypothetical protein